MKIRLMPRVEDISPEYIEGSNVIAIDMLRATSVIVMALYNGAEKVVPVLSPEEALKMRGKYKNAVLGGERQGVKIDGFDFGNSPLEYSKEAIDGKTLIITTSNGTRAIKGSSNARNIFIGSMLNGKAVAQQAGSGMCDISIICAGTLGNFSLDDFLCGGYIIDELLKTNTYEMDDVSFLAHHTFIENKENLNKFIKNASHTKYLTSIGFEEDIKYCCNMDTIDISPVYKEGVIT